VSPAIPETPAPPVPEAAATPPGVSLVGLYWTLAGPVQLKTGREWSLFDFRDRCEEAARAMAGAGADNGGMYRRAYQATAAQFRPDPATPTGPGASPREGA